MLLTFMLGWATTRIAPTLIIAHFFKKKSFLLTLQLTVNTLSEDIHIFLLKSCSILAQFLLTFAHSLPLLIRFLLYIGYRLIPISVYCQNALRIGELYASKNVPDVLWQRRRYPHFLKCARSVRIF